MIHTPANPYANVPEAPTFGDLNDYINSETLLAWNEITIIGSTIVTETNILSINDIENNPIYLEVIDPNTGFPVIQSVPKKDYTVGDVIPGGRIFINRPNCGLVNAVSQQDLNTFCDDPNKYNPIAISFTEDAESREAILSNENQKDFNLRLYPNPVQQISTLEFFLEKDESIDISIYNVLGQQVKFFNSKNPIINGKHKMELDLTNLPPGNYILELTSESMKESIKMIKH